jgi:ferritin-like metal-binding protein YciE
MNVPQRAQVPLQESGQNAGERRSEPWVCSAIIWPAASQAAREANMRRRMHPSGSKAMGLFTKDIKSMEDLFLHTLQDVYYAENQIVKALPKMIDKSTNRELAAGLRNHLRETETQVTRLQQVFEKLGEEPKGVDCPAMDGLIKEADEVAGEVEDKKVLDAAIIGSAQAVEHYEISRYGTLIAWAEELGHNNVVSLLNANLKEEKAADKKLNMLAEGGVNKRASGRTTAKRGSTSSSRTKQAAARTATSKRTGKARRRIRGSR